MVCRYRSGYSFKDGKQECILAIRIKHENFMDILSRAVVNGHEMPSTSYVEGQPVRIQRDPEGSAKLQALPYRSIQIGIPRTLQERWMNDWIESIEDVTEKAQALKMHFGHMATEEDPDISTTELIKRGLVPEERVYELPEQLLKVLKMV